MQDTLGVALEKHYLYYSLRYSHNRGHTDKSEERIKIYFMCIGMYYFSFNCLLHLFIRITF